MLYNTITMKMEKFPVPQQPEKKQNEKEGEGRHSSEEKSNYEDFEQKVQLKVEQWKKERERKEMEKKERLQKISETYNEGARGYQKGIEEWQEKEKTGESAAVRPETDMRALRTRYIELQDLLKQKAGEMGDTRRAVDTAKKRNESWPTEADYREKEQQWQFLRREFLELENKLGDQKPAEDEFILGTPSEPFEEKEEHKLPEMPEQEPEKIEASTPVEDEKETSKLSRREFLKVMLGIPRKKEEPQEKKDEIKKETPIIELKEEQVFEEPEGGARKYKEGMERWQKARKRKAGAGARSYREGVKERQNKKPERRKEIKRKKKTAPKKSAAKKRSSPG